MLLRAINMSGKIHMVPALINDDYVIRFAVCAQHATNDDVTFAWNVISEMATDVLAMCDTNKETETLKEFHRIESLEVCHSPLPPVCLSVCLLQSEPWRVLATQESFTRLQLFT